MEDGKQDISERVEYAKKAVDRIDKMEGTVNALTKRMQAAEDWMVDMASKLSGVEHLRDHYDKVIALCEKRLSEHSAIIDMLKDQHWHETPITEDQKGNHGKEEKRGDA